VVALAQFTPRQAKLREKSMDTVRSAPIYRLAAAIAAGTTTLALFSAVVAISEPHRSELVAANAARHAIQAQAARLPVTSIAAAQSAAGAATERTSR